MIFRKKERESLYETISKLREENQRLKGTNESLHTRLNEATKARRYTFCANCKHAMKAPEKVRDYNDSQLFPIDPPYVCMLKDRNVCENFEFKKEEENAE